MHYGAVAGSISSGERCRRVDFFVSMLAQSVGLLVGLSQLKPYNRATSLHYSQMVLISLVDWPVHGQGSLVRVKKPPPLFSFSLSLPPPFLSL